MEKNIRIKDLKKAYKINTYDIITKIEEIWSTKSKKGEVDLGKDIYLEEVSKGIYYAANKNIYYAKLGQKWYEVTGGIEE